MNVIQSNMEVHVIGEGTIAHLKTLADDSPKGHARVLLHESSESSVQEMVIALKHGSTFPPHRHPKGKTESYHVLEGDMDVRIFSETGKCIQSIRLSANGPARMYRVKGGIYHQPVPASDWAVYHEVFTGPYDKDRDVENGPWLA